MKYNCPNSDVRTTAIDPKEHRMALRLIEQTNGRAFCPDATDRAAIAAHDSGITRLIQQIEDDFEMEEGVIERE